MSGNNEDLITVSEANNMLLHQKTELRLQEVDKSIGRVFKQLTAISETQKVEQRHLELCREDLKQEIERDFVTKAEFRLFALANETNWKKLRWVLTGATAVLLGGSWILNQYAVVDKLLTSQEATMQVQMQRIEKRLQEFVTTQEITNVKP